jgi:hypothetical protein
MSIRDCITKPERALTSGVFKEDSEQVLGGTCSEQNKVLQSWVWSLHLAGNHVRGHQSVLRVLKRKGKMSPRQKVARNECNKSAGWQGLSPKVSGLSSL